RRAVAHGQEVVGRLRAARGRQAGYRTEILVAERYAVQRTARRLPLQGPGARQRSLGIHGDEVGELRIEALDAIQVSAYDFHGRERLLSDGLAEARHPPGDPVRPPLTFPGTRASRARCRAARRRCPRAPRGHSPARRRVATARAPAACSAPPAVPWCPFG